MKIKIGYRDGTFAEYDSVLDALREEQVFDISKGEGENFDFSERCDDYFGISLTKDQVRELAAELLAFIEHEHFCENCGKPSDNLKRFEGGGSTGWREMRGMKLCEECTTLGLGRQAQTQSQL